MKIDLQVHSTFSDGYLSPAQLALFLHKQGIKVASLTDHNTISGQKDFELACRKYKIKTIPGLELYVRVGQRKFNILWYNFPPDSLELNKILLTTQVRRRREVVSKLEILKKRGFRFNEGKILAKYPHYVPINKIADDLSSYPRNRKILENIFKGENIDGEDLMITYFFKDKTISPNNSYLSLKRVIELKNKIGGKIIFDHPGHFNKMRGEIISKVKEMGIDGLELLSPHHSYSMIMYIQQLAQEMNFITTGGSDFHKFKKSNYKIRNSDQWFTVDSKYLRRINEIIG